ncbi:hypothetical protein HPB47_025643 [Ixodes persulcatus]|uniref:Uncharacterized protein n=1 Tax=Ixodes persulcatus TaxID=34615 RepID=A0AC60Q2T0_IXOPE|nr:hypothetical protein HPB47_025643 [Ixodes persulcatus]
MTLANETTQHTRTGNSVERDTNPDLAFPHGPSVAEWSASDEQLGSDHRLIDLTLITNVKQKVRRNTARITNWDHFRYHTSNNPPPTDADPRAWANHLLQAQNNCTKEAQTTTAIPYIDTHLLNLWKIRRKLVKKWKKTKHSKHLKHKIHKITKEAETYAEQLTTENWLQLYDSLNGQLGTKKRGAYYAHSSHPLNIAIPSHVLCWSAKLPRTTSSSNSATPSFHHQPTHHKHQNLQLLPSTHATWTPPSHSMN